MAADSSNRRGVKPAGLLVRPQAVSDKSYIESVVGFINDVVPQAYSGTTKQDDKETVLWAKFEISDINDFKYYTETQQNGNTAPLLLVLGFNNGVQAWTVPANGEAQEVLSWRQGPVRSLKILPTPKADESKDEFFLKRPLVVLCDSSSAGQQFCAANIVSLNSGDQVHCIRFNEQILELFCNKRALVVTFSQKIAVYDSCSFRENFSIIGCYPSPSPNVNPIALGPRWLAFADKKLLSAHQICGGMTGDGVQSYAATVIHAAKTITKGLTIFGETVASSLTGHKGPGGAGGTRKDIKQHDLLQPGIVTIIDILKIGKGEIRIDEDLDGDGIVAHFPAHTNEPIQAMAFDPSGMLLLTACALGNNFHIFGIFPHPTSSTLGAVHHLYTLHRGDTTAKVQDIAFSLDTRWVAVTTQRGTTHIFPITQYGGPVSVRTHLSPRVVNRYSRFQKSAGLEDIQQPNSTGRNSPVLSGSPGSTGGTISSRSYDSHPSIPYHATLLGRLGNPRLPPYPHPTTVLPLAQLKQPLSISVPGMSNQTGPKSPTSKGRRASTSSQGNETVSVVAMFAQPRAWLVGSPSLNREKRDKILDFFNTEKHPVDSLFVMGCHGNLIEYMLDPKPAAGYTKSNEDAPIELDVVAHAQWNLSRPITSTDLKLPLSNSNPLIVANEFIKTLEKSNHKKYSSFPLDQTESKSEASEENWLSQVEIITHAGPHRRLWMGPQFSFKTIQHLPNTTVVSSTSSALLSQNEESSGPSSLDMFTEELDLQSLSIRPARSNPVAMPPGYHHSPASTNDSPLLIEASSGSFEQMPGSLEVIECGSLVNVPFIPPVAEKETSVEDLKETIADAMMEPSGREFDGDLMTHQDDG